jgi:hypothetical protein
VIVFRIPQPEFGAFCCFLEPLSFVRGRLVFETSPVLKQFLPAVFAIDEGSREVNSRSSVDFDRLRLPLVVLLCVCFLVVDIAKRRAKGGNGKNKRFERKTRLLKLHKYDYFVSSLFEYNNSSTFGYFSRFSM